MTAANFCRSCGQALSEAEKATPGAIYCSQCAPVQTAAEPAGQPTQKQAAPQANDQGISPGLGFLLGLIPGVGAIYNGQYAKGLIHALIFGLLISVVSSDEAGGMTPVFVMMIPAWVVYMAFEAYHTAQRRMKGELVDEFSSVLPLKPGGGFPAAPVFLIAAGVLFLLNNLDVLRISRMLKFWPVILIGLGIYMLYARLASGRADGANQGSLEESHE